MEAFHLTSDGADTNAKIKTKRVRWRHWNHVQARLRVTSSGQFEAAQDTSVWEAPDSWLTRFFHRKYFHAG